jgi:hypothetical protein
MVDRRKLNSPDMPDLISELEEVFEEHSSSWGWHVVTTAHVDPPAVGPGRERFPRRVSLDLGRCSSRPVCIWGGRPGGTSIGGED